MSHGGLIVGADYARVILPLDAVRNGVGTIVRAECRQCGARQEKTYGRLPPPEGVVRQFTGMGWDLRKKPICPDCAKSTKTKETKEMAEVTKMEPKAQPTEAAKKVKRMIFMALEDYYDDVSQCYKGGWTDEKVAKECNASTTFVRTIREADFGPLKEPQEVREIRAALDALTADAGKLRSRLDAFCRGHGLSS